MPVLSVCAVMPPSITVHKAAVLPYQRGFFCDDESITCPFRRSTVPSPILLATGLIVTSHLCKFSTVQQSQAMRGGVLGKPHLPCLFVFMSRTWFLPIWSLGTHSRHLPAKQSTYLLPSYSWIPAKTWTVCGSPRTRLGNAAVEDASCEVLEKTRLPLVAWLPCPVPLLCAPPMFLSPSLT